MIRAAAELGYAEATVAQVIARAPASREGFYGNFADRDDCFAAALEDVAERVTEHAAQAAVAAKEPAGAVIDAIVRFAEREPAAATLLFCESLAAGEWTRARRDRLIAHVVKLIERRWARLGDEAEGPDAPALGLVGAVFRLLALRLQVSGVSGLHQLRDELASWVASYSVGEGESQWRNRAPLPSIARRARTRAAAQSVPVVLPHRHRMSAPEVAHNHRERIMRATAQVTFEEGYHAATVADIVAAARVSRNVFYAFFPDKAAAAGEALQWNFEMAMTAAAREFFTAHEWPERLWRGGMALTLHFMADPALTHLTFVELHAIGREVVRQAHNRMMGFTLLFEEGFRQSARARALPRTTSEALAAMVVELEYVEAPRRGVRAARNFRAERTYMTLAPFIGPAAANDFVAAKLASGELA
jgi:AcrR family transcriptional regulator